MRADPHIVDDRLRTEQRQVLKSAGDADLRDAMRRTPQRRAPFKQNIAAIGLVEPADAVEERRLAGAVRPDQTEDLTFVDSEGDAVKRNNAAKAHGDVANVEKRVGRSRHAYRRPETRRGPGRPASPRCIPLPRMYSTFATASGKVPGAPNEVKVKECRLVLYIVIKVVASLLDAAAALTTSNWREGRSMRKEECWGSLDGKRDGLVVAGQAAA